MRYDDAFALLRTLYKEYERLVDLTSETGLAALAVKDQITDVLEEERNKAWLEG